MAHKRVGRPSKGKNMVVNYLRLPKALVEMIERDANRRKVTRSDVMRETLAEAYGYKSELETAGI